MTSSNDKYWKVGLFVVTTVALLMVYVTWLGLGRLERKSFDVYAYFDEPVDGLSKGSPVKFRGVTIGVVARIRAAADQKHVEVLSHVFEDALVDLRLRDADEDSPLGESPEARERMKPLRVQLIRSPLTGVAHIQGDFVDPAAHPVEELRFPTNEPMVPTMPSTWRTIEARLVETLTKLPDLVNRLDQSVAAITASITGAKFGELTAQIRETLTEVRERLASLDSDGLVADARAIVSRGRDVLTSVEDALATAKVPETLQKLRHTLDVAGEAASGLETTARTIDRATRDVATEFRDVHRLVKALERLSSMLERDPSALVRGRTNPPKGK